MVHDNFQIEPRTFHMFICVLTDRTDRWVNEEIINERLKQKRPTWQLLN